MGSLETFGGFYPGVPPQPNHEPTAYSYDIPPQLATGHDEHRPTLDPSFRRPRRSVEQIISETMRADRAQFQTPASLEKQGEA